MAEDREILRKVWEGRVAACVTLAEEDISTMGQPDPHYLMLPRVSYFPLVLDKVQKSLQRFISSEIKDNEIWLEFEGTPLKLQYPIGVLCDLHNRECESPWQLTLHFSRRPPALVSLPSRESLESQFLTSLKEADALKHRSAVMNMLQSRDHKQLWLGLVNDKFDQFWSINQKLMESSNGGGGAGCSLVFRNIPFRLHLPPSNSPAPSPAPLMRLQRPLGDAEQPLLLQHLVTDTLGDVLEEGDTLVVQGVVPPLDTPLLWLSQHLSCPDNFLHFCVRRHGKLQQTEGVGSSVLGSRE